MTPEQYETIERLLKGTTVMTALIFICLLFIVMLIFFHEWEREKNKQEKDINKRIKELIEEARKNERK